MRWWFLGLFVLAGCTPPPCAGIQGDPGVTVQLFFGRSLKGGQLIDDAAWQAFLADSVTPRFPAGLTVLQARGQWRQRATGKVISEPSAVVEIVTDGTAADFEKFEAIRRDYKARFTQESVGLVTNRSCASW
jgi:hypothetical protein